MNSENIFLLAKLRRSIRRYVDEKISAGSLQYLENVLNVVPTYQSRNYTKYIFVTDKNLIKKFWQNAISGVYLGINLWLRQGIQPCAVIGCANPKKQAEVKNEDLKNIYLSDLSIASESLALAAVEKNLGTCWIGAFAEDKIKNLLNIPKEIRVGTLLTLSIPSQRFSIDINSAVDGFIRQFIATRRKDFSEIVFKENFSQKFAKVAEPEINVKKISPEIIFKSWQQEKFKQLKNSSEIENKILNALLCARIAPSASNSQIWRFVTVEKNLKDLVKAQEAKDKGDIIYSIICCSAPWLVRYRGKEQPYALIDVPIAMSHILLSLWSENIFADLNFSFNVTAVKKLIKLPALHNIIGIINVYKKKSNQSNLNFTKQKNIVFYNKWEG